MIHFTLRCPLDHRFDGWFRNGETYEQQAAAGEIACPICNGTEITKAPMAPALALSGRGKGRDEEGANASAKSGEDQASSSAAAVAAPVPASVPPAPTPTSLDAAALAAPDPQMLAQIREVLTEVRRRVEASADYVGDGFAEEARRIHYGETKKHAIYGETTGEEALELIEEGIDVAPLPWLPRGN